MEVLSDLLRDVKLAGGVFLDAEFGEPWCIAARGKFQRFLMPEAQHLVHFHFIAEGRCSARTGAGPEIKLETGDVVVLPHGDELLIGSNLDLAPGSLADVIAPPRRGEVLVVRYGGDGTKARMVCGFLACDPHLAAPILSALPRLFRINIQKSASADWLQRSIRHSVAEAASPRFGADVILARLSEVLFVEALRCHVESLSAEHTGWLAGLRDPFVAKGLKLLHTRFAHPWTVKELAREVACSRSVLAERFTHYLGQPPIQYLTKWRLSVAASRLRSSRATLSRIADEIGYESESAFIRAFKREFGAPPAIWRRQARQRPAQARSR